MCLSPAVVEFICEMGYQDRIIGVSKEINYPENIVSITPVAHYDEIDVNKILELKPDIIFARNIPI